MFAHLRCTSLPHVSHAIEFARLSFCGIADKHMMQKSTSSSEDDSFLFFFLAREAAFFDTFFGFFSYRFSSLSAFRAAFLVVQKCFPVKSEWSSSSICVHD